MCSGKKERSEILERLRRAVSIVSERSVGGFVIHSFISLARFSFFFSDIQRTFLAPIDTLIFSLSHFLPFLSSIFFFNYYLI